MKKIPDIAFHPLHDRIPSGAIRLAIMLGLIHLWGGHEVYAQVRYNSDILPILSANCFHCHGPDVNTRKADLRLDVEEDVTGTAGRPGVVVPGKPQQSELYKRITSTHADEVMPPPESKKVLGEKEKEWIRLWIEQGAVYQKHWAFLPPVYPEIPDRNEKAWAQNEIDLFIGKKLDEKGLKPEPEADRSTLIRRLTFDLTGLPPSPEEVSSFIQDKAPDAYERVVDRLLGSERFGERMALAWMDAARYGDSSVYHADGVRDMWPWRDWTIRAYNNNMPFDQFTVEQLAGDLIPNASIAQKVASGFNRNHGTTDEGGAIDEEYRVEYTVDRVKTTSTVWLGLTLECAQCHDHKYDPLSQKEYYQFYAYFNRSSDTGLQTRNGNAPPIVYLFTPDQEKEIDRLEIQATAMSERRKTVKAPEEAFHEWLSLERSKKIPAPPLRSDWHVIQPFQGENPDVTFSKAFAPEHDIDLTKEIDGKSWIGRPEFEDGKAHALSLPDNSAAYLVRTLTVEEPGSRSISLGSDDSIKVWLNGVKVFENHATRGVAPDQDQVVLDLKPGENVLLMKIINIGGGSGFYFRMKDSGFPDSIAALIASAEADLDESQESVLFGFYNDSVWPDGLELDRRIAENRDKIKGIRDGTVTCMVMGDMEVPRKTYVLNRGHYASPIEEEEIFPGTPGMLPPLPEGAPPNRLGLARWLVQPDHPLTSRVAVNRVWQMLFGTGLVSTPEDFGIRGDRPSHPELLDWLARDFVDHGWNTKRTIKKMVMSASYRQSSRVSPEKLQSDPQNRWISRGPRFRLQGEFIRDQALAVSGLLNGTVGGRSVKPYQPPNIWNEVSLDGNLRYDQDHGEKLYRRSMYIYWKRSAPSPSMLAFDATTREKCIVRRQRTNTPLQALVTLNDVQFVEAAREFATRIMNEGGETFGEQLDYACLLALAKPADTVKKTVLRDLYESQLEVYKNDPESASKLLAFGELPRVNPAPAHEHAAWTLLAGTLLNLDEFLTRE